MDQSLRRTMKDPRNNRCLYDAFFYEAFARTASHIILADLVPNSMLAGTLSPEKGRGPGVEIVLRSETASPALPPPPPPLFCLVQSPGRGKGTDRSRHGLGRGLGHLHPTLECLVQVLASLLFGCSFWLVLWGGSR